MRQRAQEQEPDRERNGKGGWLLRGFAVLALLLAGVSPGMAADESQHAAARALVERVAAGNHLVTPGIVDDLVHRAGLATGETRLRLLYQALNRSVALRQENMLLACAERLHKEATAQGNRRYAALADAFRIYGQSYSGVLFDTIAGLEALLAKDENRNDWLVATQIRLLIANVTPPLGQFERAIRHLNAIFAMLPEEGRMATRLRAEAHEALGTLDARLRDLPGMLQQYRQALDLADAQSWPLDGEAILYNLGNVFMQEDDHGEARVIFTRMLALAERSGRAENRFYALYGLMQVAHNAGQPELSEHYAEQALATMPPPPVFAAAIAQHRAFNLIALGDPEAAARQVDIAEAAIRDGVDFGQTIYAIYNTLLRSRLAEIAGDSRTALALYKDYAADRLHFVRDTFAEDVKSIRASLEGALELEKARRALAEGARALARDEIRLQRIALVAVGIAGLAALAAFLYQRRMARELEASRQRAEAANIAKSKFLANVSHELRTPLNAIIGFSEMCVREEMGPLENPAYKEYASAIHRSGRHLLALINDILDLSRIEAHRLELDESEVAVADFVAEACELVGGHDAARADAIRLEGLDDLPPVRADRRLMRQTLANLLSNAIKFSPTQTEVVVSGEVRADGGIAISVVDKGIGMTESDLAIALQPFGQVQSVMTRAHEGTGLGLTLVKTFVELHRGRLEIRSAPGAGTRATVILPAERVLAVAEDSPPRAVASGGRA
ncbi:MAG: ATP-binding protein [Rhodothalassiaceae bacterium]